MRIALVDTVRRPQVYSIALLKLGAWRRSLGDECQYFSNALPAAGEFDAIWLTTVFTFEIKHSLTLAIEATKRAKKVKVGGVAASLMPREFERHGITVHRGLMKGAERVAPDYSLLPDAPTYSVAHTSRGCVRRCGFCMVWRVEPDFSPVARWETHLAPGAKRVLFYDNNWLAKPRKVWEEDVAKIKRLAEEGTIASVDFNQALDCRLLTEKKAALLKGVPFSPVRFAFDTMEEDGHFQDAVERMVRVCGSRVFVNYVLYNGDDSPRDLYYRLREGVRLSSELGANVKSFPMKFAPVLDPIAQRTHVGRRWTREQLCGFRAIIASAGARTGLVACVGGHLAPLEEFSYWYGKDADEFVHLLSYPKIKQLCSRKLAKLRDDRARAKKGTGRVESDRSTDAGVDRQEEAAR